MKKISILAGLALVAATAFTSCNGGSKSDLKTPTDSLSAYFGEMYGYGVKGELTSGPDSAKFDKNAFIKGLEAAMNVDTSDVSYMQGMQLGTQLTGMFRQIKEQQHVDFNTKIVLDEFKKAFSSDSVKDPQAIQMKVMELMQRVSREAIENSPEAIQNKKAGEAYINSQMKKDPTIKKTASGLAYKVVAAGEGAEFKSTDQIMVKYKGTHIDGNQFDASQDFERMSPMEVVPGFKEGLLMMKPGAKYVFYIPADLAYGPEGRGDIKPNETLVFEVETSGVAVDEPKATPAEKK